MTIPAGQTPYDAHTGDGATTAFNYNFKISSADELLVNVNAVLQAYPADYAVTGVGNNSGGQVVFVTPPGIGISVAIEDNPALSQEVPYSTVGDFRGSTHENSFDKATRLVRKTQFTAGRSLTVPAAAGVFDTELPLPVASTLLRLNAAADGVDLVSAGSIAGEITYAARYVDRYEEGVDWTSGVTTAFTLSADPEGENNTQVFLAGEYQDKGLYSVSGVTLTFAAAPTGVGAILEVVHAQALASTGDGSERTHFPSIGQIADGELTYLTSVSGTDTIVGDATPAITAYVAGQMFHWIAAGSNTGAATLNINGVGPKALEHNGAALVGGQVVAGGAHVAVYDGAQFQLLNPPSATSVEGTLVAVSGSPTSVALEDADGNTTGWPPWIRAIDVTFYGVSTNGVSPLILRLGDSGGIEVSDYDSTVQGSSTGSSNSGALLNSASVAAGAYSGMVSLRRMTSSKWLVTATCHRQDSLAYWTSVTQKLLTGGVLDRLSLTTLGGVDVFDGGEVNVVYW